jgi:hypothetical protein
MALREAIEKYRKFKIPSLSVIREKASKYQKTSICIAIISFLIFTYLIQQVPQWQVAKFGISNSTAVAQLENSYRTTLAQIIGGGAVLLGLYFAWGNLITARESQITERFTRAIDQLGNEKMEIRLGGIYALERISTESEKDYWPIIEILTAYVRKNSSVESNEIKLEDIESQNKLSEDIQAILTVIGRRVHFYKAGESNRLNLHGTWLRKADLKGAHLEGAHLEGAHLNWANLQGANLKSANLEGAHLEWADFKNYETFFTDGSSSKERTVLREANLKSANLEGADLEGARNLSLDQLSKVKTLYNAELDEDLRRQLEEEYPALFEKPD